MKKKIIGICALIMSLQAVASNAQIEVRIGQKYNRFSKLYQGSVEVTALDNNVEVYREAIVKTNTGTWTFTPRQ